MSNECPFYIHDSEICGWDWLRNSEQFPCDPFRAAGNVNRNACRQEAARRQKAGEESGPTICRRETFVGEGKAAFATWGPDTRVNPAGRRKNGQPTWDDFGGYHTCDRRKSRGRRKGDTGC